MNTAEARKFNIQETARGWDVESQTHPGQFYQVKQQTRLDEMGSMYFTMSCNCPSRKHPCKHVDAVVQARYEAELAAEDPDLEAIERIQF